MVLKFAVSKQEKVTTQINSASEQISVAHGFSELSKNWIVTTFSYSKVKKEDLLVIKKVEPNSM